MKEEVLLATPPVETIANSGQLKSDAQIRLA
jgi:hypothetical protein